MGASEPAAPLSQPVVGAFSYEHEGDRQFATTLARGLEVLRCFTPLEPLLGNKEISVRTGLPKPTVSRLTYTLTKLGYLRHNMRLGKYQLGSAVLSVGYPLLASVNVRPGARLLREHRRAAPRGVRGRRADAPHGRRRDRRRQLHRAGLHGEKGAARGRPRAAPGRDGAQHRGLPRASLGRALPDPVGEDGVDAAHAVGKRRRPGLQDVGGLDLVQLFFLYCWDFMPAGARRDPLGPEFL